MRLPVKETIPTAPKTPVPGVEPRTVSCKNNPGDAIARINLVFLQRMVLRSNRRGSFIMQVLWQVSKKRIDFEVLLDEPGEP